MKPSLKGERLFNSVLVYLCKKKSDYTPITLCAEINAFVKTRIIKNNKKDKIFGESYWI